MTPERIRKAWMVAALLLLLCPRPLQALDLDQDGLDDDWEKLYFGSLDQAGDADTDADGLLNAQEQVLGTNPALWDTDGDGLSDFAEVNPAKPAEKSDPLLLDTDGDLLTDHAEVVVHGSSPTKVDTDGDGLSDHAEVTLHKTDPTKSDTDGGFSDDGVEVLVDGTDPTKPDDDKRDSDSDGLTDYLEVSVYLTNRLMGDTDGDVLSDGDEVLVHKTDPLKSDTDGDGLGDGAEIKLFKTSALLADTDGDGLSDGQEVIAHKTNALKADTDGDLLSDGDEVKLHKSNPLKVDSDGGGLFDPVEVFEGLDPNDPKDDVGMDEDGDGLSAAYEQQKTKTDPKLKDSDGDLLTDGEEYFALHDGRITDPNDADSDDDGLLDGNEGGLVQGKLPGSMNPLYTSPMKADSDGDGLLDGQEFGLTAPQKNAFGQIHTDLKVFKPDTDPGSKTWPVQLDSDGDGLADGQEDANKNGKFEPALGETDPNNPDTDGDGMDDGWEVAMAYQGAFAPLQPLVDDAQKDNDGDGLTNLEEYSLTWPKADGTVAPNRSHPRKVDSDGDGLSDKVEVLGNYGGPNPLFPGTNPNDPDTDDDGVGDGKEDKNSNGYVDPALTLGGQPVPAETHPKVADSDGDGLEDGKEDKNGNGVFEPQAGETDPRKPDTDGDGLSDGQEKKVYGTDPLKKDSDGDGLSDALEVGLGDDADPSTKTDPTRKDSDGDGLADNLEDKNLNGKVDPGETDPLKKDSDGDGIADGVEDADQDGQWGEPGETHPLKKDSDGDGLLDGAEDKNFNGKVDPGESSPLKKDSDDGGTPDGQELADGTSPIAPFDDLDGDPDEDGLITRLEIKLGTSATQADSDGDYIGDFEETGGGKAIDSDKDGVIDARDPDSDNDGVPDKVEAGDTSLETPAADSDGDGLADYRTADADADGLADGAEAAHGTDRTKADTDGDGSKDGAEVALGTDPLDRDTDDDGWIDGLESPVDVDGDGLIGPLDPDSDNDGIFDGTEVGVAAAMVDAHTVLARRNFIADADPSTTTNPHKIDSDGDGLRDGAEDVNHNGKRDPGESDPTDAKVALVLPDADSDGLPDAEERVIGCNPNDADSDEDGVVDLGEWNFSADTDGDGARNCADADSDGDGLPDGLERGRVTASSATDPLARAMRPDADPGTTTSPLRVDSDGDGQRDGLEDVNGDGKVDPGEGDPNNPASKAVVVDTDGDGLSDAEELRVGADPKDPDTDDDGVLDGAEPNALFDSDGDGLPGVLDVDSDDDGLADGVELGVAESAVGTNVSAGHFFADADPTTRTWPLAPDSDGDGQRDGWEDDDHDGKLGPGEGDPLDPNSLAPTADADGDGLSDREEIRWKLDPNDADMDDDGLVDGQEHNAFFDLDGDKLIGARDPDSDGDGLWDGLEAGRTAADLSAWPGATDLQAGHFKADMDPATRTFVAVADSDRGGLPDGVEDVDRNGRVDIGESDPRNGLDDTFGNDDIDNDGLSNDLELILGTSPIDPDSDDDSLPDGVEADQGATPVDTDGDGVIDALDTDSDGDGLSDRLEAGPDPSHPRDFDGDGLADFRDPDSDGDGLADGVEFAVYGTNPYHPDTDGGGVSDGKEVLLHHTDPLDPSDDDWATGAGAVIQGSAFWGCGALSSTSGGAGAGLLALGALVLLAWRRRRAGAGRADAGQGGAGSGAARLTGLLGLLGLFGVAAAWPLTASAVELPQVRQLRMNLDDQGVLGVDGAGSAVLLRPSVVTDLQYLSRALVIAKDGLVRDKLLFERLALGLGVSVHVWRGLSVAGHVDASLYQSGKPPPGLGDGAAEIDRAALGDPTLAVKYVLRAAQPGQVGYAFSLPVGLPLGTDGAYMARSGPSLDPTFIASWELDRWRAAVNAGARLQSTMQTWKLRDGPVLHFEAGASRASRPLGARSPSFWVDVAVSWQTPLDGPLQDSALERLEGYLALRMPLGRGLHLLFGSGVGLWPGFGVPLARPFFTFRYTEPVPEPPRPPVQDPLGVPPMS